ncbi:hypothetical protein IFM89_022621 [Coptis chinensis]|uniref:Uncharacterized protein n=1 Tax=Coptis chinensis TaxID=261450 RepID=A0A835M677_9MAGN|nr:hypothetical protein IFM89_022621 [Coptis chinensis]
MPLGEAAKRTSGSLFMISLVMLLWACFICMPRSVCIYAMKIDTRNNEDIHYIIGALKTLGLQLEVDSANNRAVVEGCGGQFPVGKESTKEVQLFLGNAVSQCIH